MKRIIREVHDRGELGKKILYYDSEWDQMSHHAGMKIADGILFLAFLPFKLLFLLVKLAFFLITLPFRLIFRKRK